MFAKPSVASITADFSKKVQQLRDLANSKAQEAEAEEIEALLE